MREEIHRSRPHSRMPYDPSWQISLIARDPLTYQFGPIAKKSDDPVRSLAETCPQMPP
jgi:hypothetical protein